MINETITSTLVLTITSTAFTSVVPIEEAIHTPIDVPMMSAVVMAIKTPASDHTP